MTEWIKKQIPYLIEIGADGILLINMSRAVFFNLFGFTAPLKRQFEVLSALKHKQKVVKPIFGGTPSTSSRHPFVPRHPG